MNHEPDQPARLGFNVKDFGAAGDGHALETRPIQSAIDTCGARGGGTVFVYAALQNGNKTNEAAAMAAKWMKDNPKDPTIPLLLAEQAQRGNDTANALSGYLKVIEMDPDNIE